MHKSRDLGGFILIDKISNATVAAGMLHFALRRSQNVHWQALDIDRDAHARLKHQQPRLLWFTGLSGAGKSTIANLVQKKLYALGKHSFLLDGDNIRHGLNRDLGFTDADRVENIRRIGEVARLMTDAGLIVLTAFISPFRAERQMVRDMTPPGEFIEIYVETPLEDGRAARRQGPVQESASRAAEALHRNRLALRGAGRSGNSRKYPGNDGRTSGRGDRDLRIADAGGLDAGRGGKRRIALQMGIAVAEHDADGGEPLEPMAHFELVGHAHAAVQLHRLLSDEAAGLADHDLCRRQRPAALADRRPTCSAKRPR